MFCQISNVQIYTKRILYNNPMWPTPNEGFLKCYATIEQHIIDTYMPSEKRQNIKNTSRSTGSSFYKTIM